MYLIIKQPISNQTKLIPDDDEGGEISTKMGFYKSVYGKNLAWNWAPTKVYTTLWYLARNTQDPASSPWGKSIDYLEIQ